MSLSIVIPAYNESKRIVPTLDDIYQTLEDKIDDFEVIVVNDGSTDNTSAVITKYQQDHPNLTEIPIPTNRGKGNALRTGILQAKAKMILTTDADGSTPISEYFKLRNEWKKNKGTVIIGSRHIKDSNIVVKQPWYRVIISRAANVIIQATLLPGIQDTQCGFKLFPRSIGQDLFRQTKTSGFGIDMEFLLLAKQAGYSITEVPVTWLDSRESTLRPVRSTFRTLKELIKIIWWHKIKPKMVGNERISNYE